MERFLRKSKEGWHPPLGLEMVVVSDFDEPDLLPGMTGEQRERIALIMGLMESCAKQCAQNPDERERKRIIKKTARAVRKTVELGHCQDGK